MRVVKSLVRWVIFYPLTFPLLAILILISFILIRFNMECWVTNWLMKLTNQYVNACIKIEKKLKNFKEY
jgi:hypothetical protein